MLFVKDYAKIIGRGRRAKPGWGEGAEFKVTQRARVGQRLNY